MSDDFPAPTRRHRDQDSQRDVDVDVSAGCARARLRSFSHPFGLRRSDGISMRSTRPGTFRSAKQGCSGSRPAVLGDDFAPSRPAPGPQEVRTTLVGGFEVFRVVLDDDHAVAEIAQSAQRRDQAAGCRVDEALSTARRGRTSRPTRLPIQLGRQPDALGLPSRSVAAARSSVRYSRPTSSRKPSGVHLLPESHRPICGARAGQTSV